jgi:6-pyruvoyltetrahydropterin/6-carboxytetrahydropterin synthase
MHGHSYTVEVFVTARGLDNGQMLLDFGLMKGPVKDFIDSFDHAYSMWTKESDEFKEFVNKYSARWIEMPVSPSAEAYSLMFFYVIDAIINHTVFNNGEKGVRLQAVRVHETATGYAEAVREDLMWWKYPLIDIKFSDQVMQEWKDPDMFKWLIKACQTGAPCFMNPRVIQQV